MENQSEQYLKQIIHDLNSLFTKILNSVELLKRKVENSGNNIPLLNSIETNTYLASEIIEELIPGNNKSSVSRLVSLNSVINEVVNSFIYQKKKKIYFDLQLDSSLQLITGKYSDFFRLVLNLISNSFEAIESEGNIIVKTKNEPTNKKIILEIKDDGIGIDEKVLPFIFNEDFSTKVTNKISGVGLSIVKSILEKYNGEIYIESNINIGTKIIIRLPSSFHKEEIIEKDNKTKILIAEDENILRELLAELFLSYNFSVMTVQNGKELLDIISRHHFDILLIDKKMPELDGISCIKIIRENGNHIPIILASGSIVNVEEDIINIVQKVVLKPYNFEEILSAVRELVH